MFAMTQSEYYLALLKYLGLTFGIFSATVIFLGIVYGLVYFAHYWK